MRLFVTAFLSVLVGVGLAASALAGTLVDPATKAEALIKDGKTEEAYDLLRGVTSDLGATIPFGIRRAMFVSEKPVAFGSYKGAASNAFPVGSTLITYTEPVGLTWVKEPSGMMTTRFAVDFELRSPSGEKLAGQKSFGNFKLTSRERLQEVFTPLTLDVSQVPKGDYVVRYVFTDLNSKAETSVSQPFSLK